MGEGNEMKVAIRSILVGVCGMLSSGCFAFIYEVKVLRKWDKERSRYHYFIGCSDFHDKRHDATASQVDAIHELLRQMPRQDTKVIVEDLSTENNCGRKACGRYYLNSRGGILGGLAQTCQSYRISVDNPEYRYCRVIALGPLLHDIKADINTIASLKGIRVQDVVQEVQGTVEEIKQYQDGSYLSAWYLQHLKDLAKQIERLKISQHSTESMADYIRRHTTHASRLQALKHLLTFDSGLLDVKMVHSVCKAADKERIIAFAGGTHIMRVVDTLKKMGYKEVYSTKPQYFNERNLEKCLGSNITDGTFCVRPYPVSHHVFKKIAYPGSL